MPRHLRAATLETRSSRLKLPVSTKPIFVRLRPGIGLGYRRNKTAGNWVLRRADGRRGNTTRTFALADDYSPADGIAILDYWQAQDRAVALAQEPPAGEAEPAAAPTAPLTVARAIRRYAVELAVRGGERSNATRLMRHLGMIAETAAADDALGGLAGTLVAELTSETLRQWRNQLAGIRKAATVNRVATVFKAALNLAADHHQSLGRRAWEVGLEPIPDAEEPRNCILTEPDIRRIVDEAYRESPEFGLLVEVSAVTGARFSQLTRLRPEHLQSERADPRLMMPSSKKGKGNKVPYRPVPIPPPLAARLRGLAEGRTASLPQLVKPDGTRWRKSDHSRPFARCVRRAGLAADVTLYALRHSNIVRHLLAGTPVRVVAVNHDTSIRMIEQTYSRFITDHADAHARMALLDLSAAPKGEVVRMAGAKTVGAAG
jgi:integrase